jgi:hypothetical protein
MVKKYFFLFVLVLCSQWGLTQKLKIKQAESYYELHRYYDANFIYKELIQKDGLVVTEHDTLFRHAARTAENTKDFTFAYEILKELAESHRSTPSDLYDYFRLSLLMGDYTAAAGVLANPMINNLPAAHLAYLKAFRSGQVWKELETRFCETCTVEFLTW